MQENQKWKGNLSVVKSLFIFVQRRTSATRKIEMVAALSMCFGFLSCEHKLPVAVDTNLTATFSSIQENILTPKCVNAGCHPPAGPMSLREGVAYENLVNKPSAYDMPRVDPGNPDNSALYLKLIGDARVGGAAFRMPLGRDPLSDEEITAVRDWIQRGAKND